MAITRLSGGNTPSDGSDPRTFPAIWNPTADLIEANETGITALQNLIGDNNLNDINDVEISAPADGEFLVYDNGNWVNGVGGLIAVKSAIRTAPEVFSNVEASGNRAVGGLSITHEVADPANRLIISAFFGAAANNAELGQVGIAVHDGTGLIAIGDAANSRASVTAGGIVSGTSSGFILSMPSVTFVHTPGAGSKTYTVRAINVRSDTRTLFINRGELDFDNLGNARAVSSLVIQEVAV